MDTLHSGYNYPDNGFTALCFTILIIECSVWLIMAITETGEKRGVILDYASWPKFLFTGVSFAIAYFIQKLLVPESIYNHEFSFMGIIIAIIIISLATIFVYNLIKATDVYDHVFAIFVIVNVIYLLLTSIGRITNTGFSYYVIATFVGGNGTYVFLKLESKK